MARGGVNGMGPVTVFDRQISLYLSDIFSVSIQSFPINPFHCYTYINLLVFLKKEMNL